MVPKAVYSPLASQPRCSIICSRLPSRLNQLSFCKQDLFRKGCMMFPNRLALVLCAGLLWSNPARANDKKLTEDDRVELLRGLMAEYATVKSYLPRSKKPLAFNSDGTWDKHKWEEQGRELGPAARVGDLVQITRVGIEDDKILLEINNGLKKKGGHWYDHVEVGMGNRTSPIGGNQNTYAPG